MDRYGFDHAREHIENRQNAFMDGFRRQDAQEYDRVYVSLLDTNDMAELGGMVRRLRDDTLTLHFAHHVDAPAVAVKKDIELTYRQNEPRGLYLCSSREPVILFHVFYAVERLLNVLRLSNDPEIETLLLRRMTTLLNEFQPPKRHFAELCERTNRLMNDLSTVYHVAGEKMAYILNCTRQDPTQVTRLERWMALVVLFTSKRVKQE